MGIEFDAKKILVVDVHSVRPNTWNPKDTDTVEFEKIKEGIKLKGQRMPIVVRETGDTEVPYEILDGQQRWTAAEALGFDKVLVYNEGQLPDKDAKELTIWYQQQVPFNNVELAYLVTEMAKEYKDLQLPFTEMEMKEFEDLAKFDFDQFDKDGKPDDEEGEPRTIHVVLTELQYNIVRQALDQVVEADQCSEGQALERICADFLGGMGGLEDKGDDHE